MRSSFLTIRSNDDGLPQPHNFTRRTIQHEQVAFRRWMRNSMRPSGHFVHTRLRSFRSFFTQLAGAILYRLPLANEYTSSNLLKSLNWRKTPLSFGFHCNRCCRAVGICKAAMVQYSRWNNPLAPLGEPIHCTVPLLRFVSSNYTAVAFETKARCDNTTLHKHATAYYYYAVYYCIVQYSIES